jgi:hypothetical protein
VYVGAAFVYRRICGEVSDGVSDVAGVGEQMERTVAVEVCRGLLYNFVSKEIGGELPDLALIAGKDHLLEGLRVRAGEMFVALQCHPVTAQIEVPAIFLLLPTFGGDFSKVIVEAVADPVIEQSFTGAFEQGRARSFRGHATPVMVSGIKTGGPFVCMEEAGDTAIATGCNERDKLGSCEDVLFVDLQRFLVNVIIHAVAMLAAAEVGQLFEQVHEAPGDPQPVSAGDDKIVNVFLCFRAAFG